MRWYRVLLVFVFVVVVVVVVVGIQQIIERLRSILPEIQWARIESLPQYQNQRRTSSEWDCDDRVEMQYNACCFGWSWNYWQGDGVERVKIARPQSEKQLS